MPTNKLTTGDLQLTTQDLHDIKRACQILAYMEKPWKHDQKFYERLMDIADKIDGGELELERQAKAEENQLPLFEEYLEGSRGSEPKIGKLEYGVPPDLDKDPSWQKFLSMQGE